MITIALVNLKGGVGKTVSAIHLGATLAREGYSTLLIDVDLQAGLTAYFKLNTHDALTTEDVLLHGAAIHKAAQPVREKLHVLPATADMENAEVQLAASPGGEVRLRRAMKALAVSQGNSFDFVLIDCPSGWGAVTRNALLASNALLVPINSEPAAVQTAAATVAGARDLSEYHDHDIELLGVLLTRWRNTRAVRAVDNSVKKQWGEAVFATPIRQAEKINELAIMRQTVADVSDAFAGPVGADYTALAQDVVARCEKLNNGGQSNG